MKWLPFPRSNRAAWMGLALGLLCPGWLGAQTFLLPTDNRAIFEEGSEDQFFVPTPGRTWESGTFGCVRSEGFQFHEGVDIRCLQRDKRNEPIDPIRATAAGTVAYVNHKAGLSNFGKYIILRHSIEGIELYSLYAHLSRIEEGVTAGRPVQAGQDLGVMGRTTNTRTSISKDRAHLHFEINLMLCDRFAEWWAKNRRGYRNDHGNWNGRGLVGLDPSALFLAQQREGSNFRLAQFLRHQTELCRVWIGRSDFPWLQRHPGLIRTNPKAQSEGVAGYEVALTFAGVPFEVIPRAASELQMGRTFELLSVNLDEQQRHSCRGFLAWKAGRWQLTDKAMEILELLAY